MPPSPTYARGMAERVISGMDTLSAQAQRNVTQVAAHRKRIPELSAQITALTEEMEHTLADLRSGRFCSMCGKSKTQIEQGGEDFFRHLGRVQGKLVAATPEQIAAKEKEFTDRIRRLQDERSKAQRDLNERQTQDFWIGVQLTQGTYLWTHAVEVESALISAHEQIRRAGAQRDLNDVLAKISGFESERRTAAARRVAATDLAAIGARKAEIQRLDQSIAYWQKIESERRPKTQFLAYDQLQNAVLRRNGDASKINALLDRTNGSTMTFTRPSGVDGVLTTERHGQQFAFGEIPTPAGASQSGTALAAINEFFSILDKLVSRVYAPVTPAAP
jgi:hypothetical protein